MLRTIDPNVLNILFKFSEVKNDIVRSNIKSIAKIIEKFAELAKGIILNCEEFDDIKNQIPPKVSQEYNFADTTHETTKIETGFMKKVKDLELYESEEDEHFFILLLVEFSQKNSNVPVITYQEVKDALNGSLNTKNVELVFDEWLKFF